MLETYPDIDINKKTSDGKTPLMYAIDLGYKNITEIFLEKVQDFDIQDNRGFTALMQLINKLKENPQGFKPDTWKSVVSKLIEKSKNTNVKNGEDLTAWQLAVIYKFKDIADEIMNSSEELQKDVAKNLFVSRDFESAKSILDKYKTVSVSTLTEEVLPGQSVWGLAKKERNIEMMQLYLNYLKDKENDFRNRANKDIESIEKRDQRVADLLWEVVDETLRIADEAAMDSMFEAMKKRLYKKVDDCYRERLEDLENWCRYDNEIIEQAEREQIRQKREEANRERTARELINSSFINAVRNNNLNQVEEKLIEEDRGERRVTQDTVNEGFLLAARKGHKAIVEMLLDEASINDKDPDGYTALMLAAQNGHLEVVGDLVANGATIDANNNGYTALRFAAENGHADVVEYLLDAGARTKYLDETLNKVKEKIAQNDSPIEDYKRIQEVLSGRQQVEETFSEKEVETKTWNVLFWNKASKDYNSLDENLKKEIDLLLGEIQKNPFERRKTPGQKPEPLYGNLRGFFSRRINGEHRLVYRISGDNICVVACNDHYEDLNTKTKSELRNLTSFNQEWNNGILVKVSDQVLSSVDRSQSNSFMGGKPKRVSNKKSRARMRQNTQVKKGNSNSK